MLITALLVRLLIIQLMRRLVLEGRRADADPEVVLLEILPEVVLLDAPPADLVAEEPLQVFLSEPVYLVWSEWLSQCQ